MQAGMETPCTTCGCMHCRNELAACQNDMAAGDPNDPDPGCVEIRKCAQRTGCSGIDCYFPMGPCMMVIDTAGGPFGSSTALAQKMGDCLNGTNDGGVDCPCPDPVDGGARTDGGAMPTDAGAPRG
jgi:hypothetical protein